MDGRVVVGVDGSSQSLAAVDWAVAEVRARPRRLHLLYACGWSLVDLSFGGNGLRLQPPTTTPEWVDLLAEKILAEAAGRVDINVPVTTEVSTDLPGRALLTASQTAGLVVLGSKGVGGFAGLLVGSVASQVTSHGRCPVVVVRDAAVPDGPVVVGVDGSPTSQRALEFAHAFAAAHHRDLCVLHARPSTGPTGPTGPDALPTGTAEVRVERRLVTGRAAPALIEASAGASLTVVGSRGHGGFTGLLLGSVGHQVLHHAAGPVAVVHVP